MVIKFQKILLKIANILHKKNSVRYKEINKNVDFIDIEEHNIQLFYVTIIIYIHLFLVI